MNAWSLVAHPSARCAAAGSNLATAAPQHARIPSLAPAANRAGAGLYRHPPRSRAGAATPRTRARRSAFAIPHRYQYASLQGTTFAPPPPPSPPPPRSSCSSTPPLRLLASASTSARRSKGPARGTCGRRPRLGNPRGAARRAEFPRERRGVPARGAPRSDEQPVAPIAPREASAKRALEKLELRLALEQSLRERRGAPREVHTLSPTGRRRGSVPSFRAKRLQASGGGHAGEAAQEAGIQRRDVQGPAGDVLEPVADERQALVRERVHAEEIGRDEHGDGVGRRQRRRRDIIRGLRRIRGVRVPFAPPSRLLRADPVEEPREDRDVAVHGHLHAPRARVRDAGEVRAEVSHLPKQELEVAAGRALVALDLVADADGDRARGEVVVVARGGVVAGRRGRRGGGVSAGPRTIPASPPRRSNVRLRSAAVGGLEEASGRAPCVGLGRGVPLLAGRRGSELAYGEATEDVRPKPSAWDRAEGAATGRRWGEG